MVLDFRIIVVSSTWGPKKRNICSPWTPADKVIVIHWTLRTIFPATQRCITGTEGTQQDSCEVPRFSFAFILFFFYKILRFSLPFLCTCFISVYIPTMNVIYQKLKRNNTTLYYFFWVIPQRLYFMCRRFGILYLFQLRSRCKHEESFLFTPAMKMEQTEYSETSTHKMQTLGNHPN